MLSGWRIALKDGLLESGQVGEMFANPSFALLRVVFERGVARIMLHVKALISI